MELNPTMEAAWAEWKAFVSGEAGLEAERRLSARSDLSAAIPSERAGALVRLTIRDWPRKPIACLQAGLAAQVTTGTRVKDFARETARLSRLLEDQGLSWQHGEQILSGADFKIREYPEGPEERLPDERFELRLRFLTDGQLRKERDAHRATARQLVSDLKLLRQVNEILKARAWWLPARDWNALVRRTEKARSRKFPGETAVRGTAPVETEIADRGTLRQMIQDLRHELGDGRGWERLLKQRLAVVSNLFDQWELLPDPAAMAPGLVLTAACVSEKRRRFTWDRLSRAIYLYLESEQSGTGGDGKNPPEPGPSSPKSPSVVPKSVPAIADAASVTGAPTSPMAPMKSAPVLKPPSPAKTGPATKPASSTKPTPATKPATPAKPASAAKTVAAKPASGSKAPVTAGPKATGEKKPSPPPRTAPGRPATAPVAEPPATVRPVTAAPAADIGFNLDEL